MAPQQRQNAAKKTREKMGWKFHLCNAGLILNVHSIGLSSEIVNAVIIVIAFLF